VVLGASAGPFAGSPRVLELVVSCLRLAAIFGEVAGLPAIVAWVPGRCRLLWRPDCYLLLLLLHCSRGVVVLLLLRLVLLAVAPKLLRRSTQLPHGWCVDYVVLQRSNA
jgi:hypothetical protein